MSAPGFDFDFDVALVREWCYERHVGESQRENERKDRVWRVIQELQRRAATPRAAGSISDREAVERERTAFIRGWGYQSCVVPDVKLEAVRYYPFPKITRPLRVTLSDGSVWSYEPDDSDFPLRRWGMSRGEAYCAAGIDSLLGNPANAKLLARILSGETELVDEDTP